MSELRVVGAVGPRLERGLEHACEWFLWGNGTSSRADLVELAPDLVLVEAGSQVGSRSEQVAELAAYAHEAGAGAAVWLTDPTAATNLSEPTLAHLDAVFSTDPGFDSSSAARRHARPVGLPHAASEAALSGPPADRGAEVGLIAEAGRPWDQQFSGGLAPFLAAAGDRLAILAMEPSASEIPEALKPAASAGATDSDRVSFIRGCGAVLVAAPPGTSWLYVPSIAFDSVAIGVAAIAIPKISPGLVLPRLLGSVAGGKTPEDLISIALERGEFEPGRREAGMRIVRNEHTYGHRLATIASALGLTVVPDA